MGVKGDSRPLVRAADEAEVVQKSCFYHVHSFIINIGEILVIKVLLGDTSWSVQYSNMVLQNSS